MATDTRWQLAEIEHRLCDLASEQLDVPRHKVSLDSRLIEDLHCDSLELVELVMAVEETFGVSLPDDLPIPVYKAVFTRSPFRLADLAELVYLRQGTGTPQRHAWRGKLAPVPAAPSLPFTQLGGRWRPSAGPVLERLTTPGSRPAPEYRRRRDGMRCVLIPSAKVAIGCDADEASADERPRHTVELDRFLIDAEPVSTTAYCRFLNSIAEAAPEMLSDWFVLEPDDDRGRHQLLQCVDGAWQPLPGADRWPMILVSWYGANAYSLWVNGRDWHDYRDDHAAAECFLPSEAQWEYAARGNTDHLFPWGNEPATPDRMRFARHRRALPHEAGVLPLADVNEALGMSPFGLHHMAGNVWQWCRDWYDEGFYETSAARGRNPLNRTPTTARSERGGSWVGPAELCRSTYRRGRPPAARGRCLGFRCLTALCDLP